MVMGLKCSLLGHSYEPAGVEREREKQGSEVVTVSRELERCSRCDAERVVSESTEVTAVVDADGVDVDGGGGPGAGGGFRSGGQPGERGASDAPAAGRAAGAGDDYAEGSDGLDLEDRDPEEEDAEILSDEDDPEREPGQWPEETESSDEGDDEPTAGSIVDPTDDSTDGPATGGETADEDADDESLAGITDPDEAIVCPECDFDIEAESGYREGDPCPECGAWLEAERNP